jgi:hypothetical protein
MELAPTVWEEEFVTAVQYLVENTTAVQYLVENTTAVEGYLVESTTQLHIYRFPQFQLIQVVQRSFQ